MKSFLKRSVSLRLKEKAIQSLGFSRMMEMFVMDDCRMAANDVVINNQVLRLVINLDRSPKRLESISKQLADQSLSFERFPAVDGHKLTKEELSRLEAPYNAPEKFVFRKALWPNEIACFLSHAACWEKLVKSDCEWGLIMEDDIVLSLRFKLFAMSSEWIPEGVRVIQLHGSHQSFAVGESYPVRDTELLRKLFKNPCYQAGWNKNVPFSFS